MIPKLLSNQITQNSSKITQCTMSYVKSTCLEKNSKYDRSSCYKNIQTLLKQMLKYKVQRAYTI